MISAVFFVFSDRYARCAWFGRNDLGSSMGQKGDS